MPSSTGGVKGTLAYMAPEQHWDSRSGKRPSLRALGIMLAEMALGERPTFRAPPPRAPSWIAGPPSGTSRNPCDKSSERVYPGESGKTTCRRPGRPRTI